MMGLDPRFAAALRAELVRRAARRPWWRSRAAVVSLGLAFGGLVVGGGVAIAHIGTEPGGVQLDYVAEQVTAHGSGPGTIMLGEPPRSANAIWIDLTCETAGTFALDGWGSLSCDESERGTHASGQLPIPGASPVGVLAGSGERWSATARYVDSTLSDWEVNATGQSHGAQNMRGVPDLIAVTATNGRAGYVYARDLAYVDAVPDSPSAAVRRQAERADLAWAVPVFEADGVREVGFFLVGPADPDRIVTVPHQPAGSLIETPQAPAPATPESLAP